MEMMEDEFMQEEQGEDEMMDEQGEEAVDEEEEEVPEAIPIGGNVVHIN